MLGHPECLFAAGHIVHFVLLAGDRTLQVDSEIIVDTDGNEDVYRVVGFEVEPKSILHDDPSPAARLTRLS